MANPSTLATYKVLPLTEEDAFALLEMCTLTLAAESPSHLRVLAELSTLCREWLTPLPANNGEERGVPFVSTFPYHDATIRKEETVSAMGTIRSPAPDRIGIDACRVSWISFARSG